LGDIMPDLYNEIGQNAQKTRETTNLGTRKLAFYTFMIYDDDLVATKDDSNGLYSRIVQTLQQAGAELYWLGEPHKLSETFTVNWNFLNYYQRGDSEAPSGFVFAIPDDADGPITLLPHNTNNPYGTATATLTNDLDPNWITFDGNFLNNDVYTGMPIVFSGTTFGGIVAGKTYYIKDHALAGSNLVIKLSETADFEVLDIQNPPQIGGEPGPVFELTTGSGSMTARIDWLDAYYQGTAGDYISGCCVDMTYPSVQAAGFMYAIYQNLGPGPIWVDRCMPSYGIFPAWWAN
jgi:hypothetical protein